MVEDRHDEEGQPDFVMALKVCVPRTVGLWLCRLSVTARVALAVQLLNSAEAELRKDGGLALLDRDAEAQSWRSG